MLVRVSGSSGGKLLHHMRSQIDEQDRIIAKHRQDFSILIRLKLYCLDRQCCYVSYTFAMKFMRFSVDILTV